MFEASEEVVLTLRDAHPKGVLAQDVHHLSPLRYARPGMVVRLVLHTEVSSVRRMGHEDLKHSFTALLRYANMLPSESSTRSDSKEGRRHSMACHCLAHLLQAHNATISTQVLTILDALPSWFYKHALGMKVVQAFLNDRMSERFPVAVLLCDLYTCKYLVLLL